MPPVVKRCLVLLDGDVEGLVALALAAEECAARGGTHPPGATCIEPAGPRVRASVEQARRHGVEWLAPPAPAGLFSLSLGAVGEVAMQKGADCVVWPVRAGRGAERVRDAALALDRALLLGRLLSLEADVAGVPEVRFSTPLVDLDDEQLAELAADLGVDLELCWWASDPSPHARSLRQRWSAAMDAFGVTLGGAGAGGA